MAIAGTAERPDPLIRRSVPVRGGPCGVGNNMSRDEFYTADVRVVWPSAPASGESRTTGALLPAVMSPARIRGAAVGQGRR